MGKAERVALVTGAHRKTGIGFEVCRQLGKQGFAVVLSGRDAQATDEAAQTLRAEGLVVQGRELDVADLQSVGVTAAWLEREYGRLDVLVNNAAATAAYGQMPSNTDLQQAANAMQTTFFGAWRLTQAMLPLLRQSAHGRIVNVSSGAGSHGDKSFGLTSNNAMGPAYATSKAALNALTVLLANELATTPIIVNAVCPGFTATFPGAESMGARPVAQGAASVMWAALLADEGTRGGFFRDGEPLPW